MDSNFNFNFNLMETLEQCKSYCYRGKKVITHSQIFMGFLLVCLIEAILVGVVCLVFGVDTMMSVLTITMIIITFLIIAIPIKVFQIDAMKALTQYFRDENGDFYKVQILGVCSDTSQVSNINRMRNDIQKTYAAYDAMKQKENDLGNSYQDAQSKVKAYHYMMRYKEGFKDWNAFDGGEAKVRYLGKLVEVSKNKFTFLSDTNQKKVKRISENFQITL